MVDRVRGGNLQRKRKALFARSPLCEGCQAKTPPITRIATQRDHKIPLHKGGLDDESNEQGLCDECHLKKSKEERGHQYKKKVITGLDGFPINLTDRRGE